jgi:hypothetical protein
MDKAGTQRRPMARKEPSELAVVVPATAAVAAEVTRQARWNSVVAAEEPVAVSLDHMQLTKRTFRLRPAESA